MSMQCYSKVGKRETECCMATTISSHASKHENVARLLVLTSDDDAEKVEDRGRES